VPANRSQTLNIALACAVLSLAAVVVTLCRLDVVPLTSIDAAAANSRMLWPFWIASGLCWAALTVLWIAIRHQRPAGGRKTAIVVIGVAVIARVIVLVVGEPALSDDVYRYAFDGGNLAHGINPYTVRPSDRLDDPAFAERWPGESELLPRMNNPDMTTIYLPTSQWVFAATPTNSTRVYRAVFTAFDVAVIALILVGLARAGRSQWWATLYAWHPIPLAEIAGSGHQESLGVLLLVGTLLLADRMPRRVWAWTGLLAAATLVKPVVVPVAAFALKGQRLRVWLLSAAVGVVVCTALSAPLWLTDRGEPLGQLLETADRFRLKWAHFGSVYEPLLWTVESLRPQWNNDQQEVLARRVCTAMVIAVLVGVWWRGPPSLWGRTRWIMLAMVLLSPTAHPWYLLWALAMVPMAPGLATWVASLTLSWSYVAWMNVTRDGTAGWGVSPWIMLGAYAPIYATLALLLYRGCRSTGSSTRSTP
jgi:hypothetical protein